MYSYDANIISDLHKDARGYRPSEDFWAMWKEALPAGKQLIWDNLCAELEQELEEEKIREQYALENFEHKLKLTMNTHKIDEETALRWMTQIEQIRNSQDVEHWVWQFGILFTERGKAVVKILKRIYNV